MSVHEDKVNYRSLHSLAAAYPRKPHEVSTFARTAPEGKNFISLVSLAQFAVQCKVIHDAVDTTHNAGTAFKEAPVGTRDELLFNVRQCSQWLYITIWRAAASASKMTFKLVSAVYGSKAQQATYNLQRALLCTGPRGLNYQAHVFLITMHY